MIIAKVTKRYIVLFTAAFLLCSVFRIVLYRTDFTLCFAQFYCGALTAAWASTATMAGYCEHYFKLSVFVFTHSSSSSYPISPAATAIPTRATSSFVG